MNIVDKILNLFRPLIGLEVIDESLEYYLNYKESLGLDRNLININYGITKLDSIVDKYYAGYTIWPYKTNYCSIDELTERRLSSIYRVIVDGVIYEMYYPKHGYDDHK
jgi:hypothetical protein